MGMKLKSLICLFRFLVVTSPIMAFVYLLIWIFQIYVNSLFVFLNKIFGFFPSIIEKIIYVESDIAGTEVSMGYVHAACFMIIVMFVSKGMLSKFEKLNIIQENKELERRSQVQKELKKIKEKRKQEVILKRDIFFGLFEFKLNYFIDIEDSLEKLKKLKIEYCKMLLNKVKEKYPKVKFLSADKIYFICDDFSLFSSLTRDIVKVFKVFLKVGNEKSIKTEMLLSYWAGDKNSNAKEVYRILTKINELNYVNQIVVASGIYHRYKDIGEQNEINFKPVGTSKIMNVLLSGDDLDISLYATKQFI